MPILSVAMSHWQRAVYRYAPWLGLLIFLLVAAPVLRPFLATGLLPRGPFLIICAIALGASIYAIATMTWYARRVIAECSYDGCMLQYSTVGHPETAFRPIQELTDIDEWREARGRFGGPALLGYELRFRDTEKLYLLLTTPNAPDLARRLAADRWPDRPSTL